MIDENINKLFFNMCYENGCVERQVDIKLGDRCLIYWHLPPN